MAGGDIGELEAADQVERAFYITLQFSVVYGLRVGSTNVSAVVVFLLIAFLAAKELVSVSNSGLCLRMGRSLNVAIIPMIMVFVVIVLTRASAIIG